MPTAFYAGPKSKLRVTATDTVLRRGVETQVTHREADLLAASTADVTVEGRIPFDQLTVADLKHLCRQVGADTDGVKADLIARLEDSHLEAAPDGTL